MVNALDDLVGNDPCLVSGFLKVLAQIVEHDHEFITAQTGNRIVFPHTVFQAFAHLLQQHIADTMTMHVVERLEIIKIDIQQGAVTGSAQVSGQRLLHAVKQQAAIRQIRQRVKEGQVVDLRFRSLALADVADHQNLTSPRLSGEELASAEPGPERTAISTLQTQFFLVAIARKQQLLLGKRPERMVIIFRRVEAGNRQAGQTSRTVAENLFCSQIGKLDDLVPDKQHAGLNVFQNHALLGKREIQTFTHLFHLHRQLAEFIGATPSQRLIQIACRQLVGKRAQTLQRPQHPDTDSNQHQRQGKHKLAEKDAGVNPPDFFKLSLLQERVAFQLHLPDQLTVAHK